MGRAAKIIKDLEMRRSYGETREVVKEEGPEQETNPLMTTAMRRVREKRVR
jgi:hypothetical protein